MTTGQRIAAKRKEQDLSQEGLGEVLGVSRQSIYKWESDTSLPEIDKLVAMSRLFGVSVGWLLGVEKEPEAPDCVELSPAQLKLVEELLSRYQQASQAALSDEQKAQVDRLVEEKLAAKTKPPMKPSTRILLTFAAVWACWFGYELYAQLDGEYRLLSNSVDNLTYSMDARIGTITSRVEDILKAQNQLTADYEAELLSADLAQNTVTFALRAVPKTYVEGMEVLFLADNGEDVLEFPAQKPPGWEFTAEVVCPLTDSITLSAVFVNGDARQTQVLDHFSGLYESSLPLGSIDIYGPALTDLTLGKDGLFHLQELYGSVIALTDAPSVVNTKLGPAAIQEVKLGLFRDRKLIRWLEPCERSDLPGASLARPEPEHSTQFFFRLPETAVDLAEGESIFYAALLTDEFGRTRVITDGIPPDIRQGDEIVWAKSPVHDGSSYDDAANYTF